MIREVLRTRRMPPYHSDNHGSSWTDDLRLSDGEIKTIVNWIEAGAPRGYAREQVVRRAAEALQAETGMTLEAFGELEYYLVDEPDPIYPVEEERGYQESGPFSKGERIREQVENLE